MSTQLTKELTAAHLNGLKSSVHALEIQITILKQLLSDETKGEEQLPLPLDESEDKEELMPVKKKRGRPAAKGFDDEDVAEEEEASEESEDVAEEEEEPAPKKSAKKITVDDINDACKAKAKRTSRDEVLTILKKKFGVRSVTDLIPSQYEGVIKAMK